MKIQCPNCRNAVPPGQVNMANDLAFCPQCGDGFKISETIDLDTVNEDILLNPPAGAWYRKEFDSIVVGASTRSPVAFFLVPFMCVWSGGSLGGIYGSQIANGEFNLTASLFGIPFLLGTILFGSIALMAVCGKVEVHIGRNSAVFTGIGRFGWTRRFDWSAVQSIREEDSQVRYPGGQPNAIVLEGRERLKFGTMLNENRQYFVLNVLKFLQSENH